MALEAISTEQEPQNGVPKENSIQENGTQKEPALLHRSLSIHPHLVTHASGSHLYLADGRKILDACGGAAVSVIGHANAEVIAATTAQLQQASYVHTFAYTTSPAEELARLVLAMGGDENLTRAFFVGSGSEANEAALKISRQYFVEKGETSRKHFVARTQAYHGNTLGAVAISSNVPRRAPFADILPPNVSFVSPANAYRYKSDEETEEEYSQRLVDEVEDEFLRVGPEYIISFIVEPVVGATTGCVPAPKGYLKGIRSLCTKYDILLHLDEVMCGVGRTGTYFAYSHDGDIAPDIVTIGKGLGGGYVPISGMLASRKVVEGLRRGTSAFNHGHTFQAHPVACAAALAVQGVVSKEGLVARAAEVGTELERLLRETFEGCKYVGNIRGRGLFWGLEFVRDREMKEPFDPAVGFGVRVQEAAFDMGVAIYPGSGTVDGARGDHVLLSPPLNMSMKDLRTTVETMRKAYDEVERHYDSLGSKQ